MDRRFLTVLGVSLIFALIVSVVFYKMTASSGSPPKQEPSNLKEVVVAARPLPVGVTIKPGDVKMGKISADLFPAGTFSTIEEVLDRPLISNILADEPIQAGRLAERGSGLGLAPIIPVGMRAVAVRVSDVAGVAGFVLPGLRVDVLVTGRPPNGDQTVTTTCLQNILVLSAGQTIQPDSRGEAINTPTVTLLVTPEQAEVLTLAGNEGRVQLVLRNGSDQAIEKTPGSALSGLYGRHGKPEPKPVAPRPKPRVQVAAAPPPPPPAPPEIIVFRGNEKTVHVVPGRTN
ncbi:MAG: Flp pilus assembly protein CpaB [Bryobacteraceae bacterium]